MGDVVFEGSYNTCSWRGQHVTSDELDAAKPEITERALDLAFCSSLNEHMMDLAQTGMAAAWVSDFLEEANTTNVLGWQVGEALAEALLEADHSVIFPWNGRRDQRIPKASLPGADLVGISVVDGEALLVFGEVKSSSDLSNPPGVLSGKSGMIQQIERILQDRAVQLELIRWLSARATEGDVATLFNEALARFVNSEGNEVRLVGALMRDTAPSEDDVSQRGQQLGDLATGPGTVELLVWYLPIAVKDWPGLVAA